MARSEPKTDSARPQVALAAALVGALLLAASFLSSLQPPQQRWTADRAREYQAASLKIQELTHAAASKTPETATRDDAKQLDDARAHFQQLQQELEAARTQPASLAVLLRALGLGLIVGGVVGYFFARSAPTETGDTAANR